MSRRESSDTRAEAAHAWATSVLFWLCLLISASMYAAVALAPKLLAWSALKQQHYENQVRLVTLERQVKYLGRVVDALENEPEFAAQLARIDFDAARPGDERITVDSPLNLDARELQPAAAAAPNHFSIFVPMLRQLTERPELRRALLTAAAALTIFAFAFFQEAAPEGDGETEPSKASPLRGFFARRYRSTNS